MTCINHRAVALVALLALTTATTFAQNKVAENPKLETVRATKPELLATENNPYALPWLPIPESNIAWKKRVWRTIDAAGPDNVFFRATKGANNNLASILLQGAMSGEYKAYDAKNDRFTNELSREELIALITPGGKNAGYDMTAISKYQVKEDWLFLQTENKLIVRILGIAPVATIKAADGTMSESPLFWIYYPDSRQYLSLQQTSANVNWDKLLEGRMFTGTVEKSSSPIWAAPTK